MPEASLFGKLKSLAGRVFSEHRWKRWRSPRSLYLLTRRTRPISKTVAVDRGTPIDRYFIEQFLEANQEHIRGVCLEVKDNDYTVRFGGAKVTKSDILDVNAENKQATIYGDIRNLSNIPDASYDCFIVTQVLQYVDDLDAAIRECARILKPGGALLVTVPTLGKIDGKEDNVVGHYWRLTVDSARYLFEKHFPPQNLDIKGWGNVLIGMSFWIGLAREELSRKQLEYYDPEYACGVTIKAIKA